MNSLLKPRNLAASSIRTYIKNYKWKGEGIQHPGFKYYPRYPDQEDPPLKPTKLFRVQRIKPVKGNPYWEKEILKSLHLDTRAGDVTIVKNIPEVNSALWKIKHLIKITPITFPNGVPTENDIDCTYLKENGELIVAKQLKPTIETLQVTDNFQNNPKKLDTVTLRLNSRKKWLSGWDNCL